MKTLYQLESTYTSDPYEPSETLVWGVFSDKDIAIKAFKDHLLKLADGIIDKFNSFDFSKYPTIPNFTYKDTVEEMAKIIREFVKNNTFENINQDYSELKNLIAQYNHNKNRNFFYKISDNGRNRKIWDLYWDFSLEDYSVGLRFDSIEIFEYQIDKFIPHS